MAALAPAIQLPNTNKLPDGKARVRRAGRARGFAPDLPAFEALIMASELADMTKMQYISRLGKLVDATGQTVAWTLGHCTESWALLCEAYGADNYRTLRAFVNLALSLLSRAAAAREGMAAAAVLDAHASWKELYASVSPQALEHYETSEPTEKMLASHVPWGELEQMRDKLITDSPHSMETLMLALYTHLPPSRIDFGSTRIYGQRSGDPPPMPDTPEEKATPNFLVIAKYPDGRVKMTLTISAFKTKSAKFPRSVRQLPAPLVALVTASLVAMPREWLLVSPRTSQPWKDDHAFGLYMRKVLLRMFGKPVTANSIRHAFATALDMNSLTPRDKDELAAKMMTSGWQLERYRMRLPQDSITQPVAAAVVPHSIS
jgi:hypothetical protein